MAKVGNIVFVGEKGILQKNNPSPVIDSKGKISVEVQYDMADIGTAVVDFIRSKRIGTICSYEGVNGNTIVVHSASLRGVSSDGEYPYPTITLNYQGFDSDNQKDPDNEYSERTVERTLSVTADLPNPVPWTDGRMITSAVRDIVYRTQEATIVKYTQTKPTEPDGTAPALNRTEILISDTTLTYTTIDGEEKSMVFNGSLPASVVAALQLKIILKDSGFNPKKLSGTNWWQCEMIKSYEYVSISA